MARCEACDSGVKLGRPPAGADANQNLRAVSCMRLLSGDSATQRPKHQHRAQQWREDSADRTDLKKPFCPRRGLETGSGELGLTRT